MCEIEKAIDRMFKHPDGYDMDGPYYVLPSDRITHDYNEWAQADKEYWRSRR